MLAGHNPHPRANCAAVGLGTDASHLDPIVSGAAIVAEQGRGLIHVDDYRVHVPIIIKVTECRPTAAVQLVNRRSSLGSDIGKSAIAQILVYELALPECHMEFTGVYFWEHMPIGHENVRPSVIIEVKQADAPPQISCVGSHS